MTLLIWLALSGIVRLPGDTNTKEVRMPRDELTKITEPKLVECLVCKNEITMEPESKMINYAGLRLPHLCPKISAPHCELCGDSGRVRNGCFGTKICVCRCQVCC